MLPSGWRKRRIELQDLALALSLELFVQLGHELLRPDFVEVLLPRNLSDLLSVHARVDVRNDVVPPSSRMPNNLEFREPIPQTIQLFVDVRVGDFHRWPLYSHTFVVG